MEFEWNPRKAIRNLRKHKVSFSEASTAFGDPLSITIPDPDHSIEERRHLTIGMSDRFRAVIVAHTERGNRIRIISAGPLTNEERARYEEEIHE